MNIIDLTIEAKNGKYITDEEVARIVEGINSCFDKVETDCEESSILDCVLKYCGIAKEIVANKAIDKHTQLLLIKTLESSFENYTDKKIGKFTSQVVNLLKNKDNTLAGELNCGSVSEKIAISEHELGKNIKDMINFAKSYSICESKGTVEELDEILHSKFPAHKTTKHISYAEYKKLKSELQNVTL